MIDSPRCRGTRLCWRLGCLGLFIPRDVLRQCCIIQTFVYLHSLYKCYIKWFIVWKRHSFEREHAQNVLRWCSFIQTFVFLYNLYKCYIKWFIVWKRHSSEREHAQNVMFPLPRLLVLSSHASLHSLKPHCTHRVTEAVLSNVSGENLSRHL